MNNNTFEQLKRTFEQDISCKGVKNSYSAIQQLSTAIAYSVLNKVLDPAGSTATKRDTESKKRDKESKKGFNTALYSVKRDITLDTKLLENTAFTANNSSVLNYDKNGNIVITDTDNMETLYKIITDTIGNGMDIVNTAVTALLDETQKAKNRGCINTENWLDIPYITKELSKKVYIQDKTSLAIKEVSLPPIVRVYRVVRAYIRDNSSKQISLNGYSYIEDTAQIDDIGIAEKIYIRQGRYADIGGYDVSTFYQSGDIDIDKYNKHSNGLYSIDTDTVDEYNKLCKQLNELLSAQQRIILKYRLQGKGLKAIATALNVREDNIKNQLKRIRVKAESIGLKP